MTTYTDDQLREIAENKNPIQGEAAELARLLIIAWEMIHESNDMLLDCAGQFLISHDDGTISHSFMSTEERLCELLVERGLMVPISRAKFRILDAGVGK